MSGLGINDFTFRATARPGGADDETAAILRGVDAATSSPARGGLGINDFTFGGSKTSAVPDAPGPTMDPPEPAWKRPAELAAILTGIAGAVALRRPIMGAVKSASQAIRTEGLARTLDRTWTERMRLPAELPIINIRPESPLISATEGLGVRVGERFKHLTEQPFYQPYLAAKPATIKQAEQQAVDAFRTTGSLPGAVSTLPQFLQESNAWRAARLPQEQAAKAYLGLSDIPEVAGPYIARRVDDASRGVTSLRGGGSLSGDLRTSLGGFQRPRQFETMLEGELAGLKYEDPRVAFLLREVVGMRLIETAKYIKGLEGRVLFRDPAAARAASPAGTAHALEGVPGAQRWWTPTKEEAEFIRANLSHPDRGRFAMLTSWANAMFRNPNLLNPAPHFLKNMLYKFGLSGGGPGVAQDLGEYWATTGAGGLYGALGKTAVPNPRLVRQFHAAMPFETSGRTADEMIARAIGGVKLEGDPLRPIKMVFRTLGNANQWSSHQIFGQLDPALRYARWKQYVNGGMSMDEAANHTWVDLIRYGTRSDLVDFWKSIPLNFFVPWRLGTLTSVYKQLKDHPVRAAMFIGAIDYLRELRYRQSGRWTHLPVDYVEGPIAQTLTARTGNDVARALIGSTFGTMLLGPGGGFAGSQIADAVRGASGQQVEWERLGNMFWGLSQLIHTPQEGKKIWDAFQRRDVEGAVKAATDLLATLALAEHPAINYRPRRLGAFLPEWLPGMQKSELVRQAEAIQDARALRFDAMRLRRKHALTIEERLEKLHAPQED